MKAGAFPVWVSSLLVCSLVGYALLVVLIQSLVPVSSLHWMASVASLHLLLYLVGEVVHWAEFPFLGSQGLELPVVFVLPRTSLVHRWC